MPNPPEPTIDQLARRAAARAAQRPEYLAAVLTAYQAQEQLDDTGLARLLRLSPSDLPWLRLCRRPQPASFAGDLDAIEERFKLDPAALAQIVRQVDAIARFQRAPAASDVGLLAAAREHEAEYKETPDQQDNDAPPPPEPESR